MTIGMKTGAKSGRDPVLNDAYDPFAASERGGEMVIFDLEYTAWEGSQERDWSEPWEEREIIQIGAVRVKDDAEFTEVDRFLCHVTPVKNPTLSDYIIQLTGIDQQTVDDEGFDFADALDVFLEFCDGARVVLCYSGDPYTLAENCQLQGMKQPAWPHFAELYKVLGRRAGAEYAESVSSTLPELVGLEPIEDAHNAMADSLAIAATLRVLRERGLL